MKPSHSKSMFNVFTLLTLLAMLFGLLPASPVQAEALANPPYAGGDFVWAKGMGGIYNDVGYSTAIDSSGNVYTTGSFRGTVDFDPGPAISNLTSVGGGDIFVSKLDSSGDFVWAKSMGWSSDDTGDSIAIDSNGNIYTTGDFFGTVDFDPGPGIFNLTTNAGYTDVFVSKLDSNGNFVWAKNMGGTYYAHGFSIALDGSSNVYTTGTFGYTADFDPGPGISNLTSAGNDDIFVSKLDSGGNFVWAKNMGGTSSDYGYDIALDSNGNVYTTGSFQGTADFDPGPGTFNLISLGQTDIFVSKLDSGGNFVWAKNMGGTAYDYGYGYSLAVDSSGNVYTTGYFLKTIDFDPGVGIFNLTSVGQDYDIFVSKLDSSGNFVWAKQMGGLYGDGSHSIALDSSSNIYITGYFYGTADFDPGAGISNLTSAGNSDIFVSKLDTNGNFVWAKSMGGTGFEYSYGITLDSSGNVHTTGSFQGTADFNPGPGTAYLSSLGSDDIFISKLENTVTPIFADVPLFYWANSFVERLFNAGITGGCSITPLMYCPDTVVTRAQMAVFLLRGEHGSAYTPPAVETSTGFTDVPVDYWAATWIKQLATEGITGGCGVGLYCPETPVTRDQMAVFLLRAEHGSSYSPPAATGVFSDVPTDYWAAAWIEQLAVEGITAGCNSEDYCPESSVTRAQMAVFLVKAFNLQ